MRCRQHSSCKAIAAVFCTAVVLFSVESFAQSSGRCFSFQNYDAARGSVEIVNRCGDWRRAEIHWCDGRVIAFAVSGSRAIRARTAVGCPMRIVGESGQLREKIHRKMPKKNPTEVSNKSASAVFASKLEREKRSDPPARASDQGTKTADGAGSSASLNFMGPVEELEATQTQIAVFPESSKRDWNTLLRTASGELLIREAEALLDRKAALQRLLGESRFSLDTPEKHEERIAAGKELQAIDRELRKFKERAKAIIEAKAME